MANGANSIIFVEDLDRKAEILAFSRVETIVVKTLKQFINESVFIRGTPNLYDARKSHLKF